MNEFEIDRRTLCLAGAGALGLAVSGGAAAQAQLAEGKDYQKVERALPVGRLPDGKRVEVLEFFWYGCPHCYAFEPSLEAWVKRLPADVLVRRVPVGFGGPHNLHQRMYYALEKQPNFAALHKKVFQAMHADRRRLDTPVAVSEWAKENGLGEQAFLADMRSMAVDAAARQAKFLAEAYGVDSVPSLGVHGKYLTAPSMVGSYDRAFAVVESLAARERG